MSTVAKGPRTDVTILNKARYSMPAHSFITVPIKPIDLPQDRDLIFKPDQLDSLTLSAHIINYNLTRVIIYNNTDLSITLSRYLRLNKVLKYEVEEYFQINIKYALLTEKPPKKDRFKLWIKRDFQGLLDMTVVFSAVTGF